MCNRFSNYDLMLLYSIHFNSDKKSGMNFLLRGLAAVFKIGFAAIKRTAEKYALCRGCGLSQWLCPNVTGKPTQDEHIITKKPWALLGGSLERCSLLRVQTERALQQE